MSNIEVTAAKISDPQSRANNQLTNGLSPAAPAKASKSKRSGTRETPQAQKASRSRKPSRAAKAGSKQDFVIEMLRRQAGASIDDIVAKTGWQRHSVRGFLSGVVCKKLKLSLVSEVGKEGVRRYHITSSKPAKG